MPNSRRARPICVGGKGSRSSRGRSLEVREKLLEAARRREIDVVLVCHIPARRRGYLFFACEILTYDAQFRHELGVRKVGF